MKKLMLFIVITAMLMACKKEKEANISPCNSEVNGVKFEFSEIPQGKFTMGSPEDELERYVDEDAHEVTISSFYMSIYEITQEQWQAVMGSNSSYFKGEKLPVENVSWNEIQEFIKELNKKTGKKYRLPTEAEWEYACRAKTNTPFNTGDNITTNQANYHGHYPYGGNPEGEYREKTTKVGTFEPNAWGLYDMHGNICEWVQDFYGKYDISKEASNNPQGPKEGEKRVIRGGNWYSHACRCRSADRNFASPDGKSGYLGFRLALSKSE